MHFFTRVSWCTGVLTKALKLVNMEHWSVTESVCAVELFIWTGSTTET